MLGLRGRRLFNQRYQRASPSNDSPRTVKRVATDRVEDQVEVLEAFLEGSAIVFKNGISTQTLDEISITTCKSAQALGIMRRSSTITLR